MKDYILEIEGLAVEFKTTDGVVKAVNGLDMQLENGKTIGLVGETGAGKTTSALSVLRLIPNPPGKIISGSIKLQGKEIFEYSMPEMEKVRGNVVSMIFQDPMTSLDPVMTVGEQIAEIYITHEHDDNKAAMKKAEEMLEMVGIPGSRSKDYPHQFSGGMRQRVGIAMALACNPKLLIADEPTTALDVTIQAQVLKLMKELKNKFNMSMIMITHDLGIVAEVCDEVSVMYAGKVVEHGNLVDIFDDTMHPYTKGLFNSIPNIKIRTSQLTPIRGLMPDPTDLPSGCPFHPRCDFATPECSIKAPEKTWLNDTHYVRCLLHQIV